METYFGFVRTPNDAIKLFEACRLGLLPRVQRRLSEKERQAIRSGSVFVWDEREAGMRRWTDGKSWSASRVSGSFLTYREMEGKRGNGFGGSRRGAGKTPDSGRGSDEDQDDGEPDGYRYKADGLMKQSFSITTSTGQHLHLISYFSRGPQDLTTPTNDSNLRNVVPAKGMYPESSLNETPGPALTRVPMQQPYMQHHPQQQGPPPHQGYPPQYQQHYWPPSPVATPPYSHGHYTTAPPSYSPASLPPLQQQHTYPSLQQQQQHHQQQQQQPQQQQLQQQQPQQRHPQQQQLQPQQQQPQQRQLQQRHPQQQQPQQQQLQQQHPQQQQNHLQHHQHQQHPSQQQHHQQYQRGPPPYERAPLPPPQPSQQLPPPLQQLPHPTQQLPQPQQLQPKIGLPQPLPQFQQQNTHQSPHMSQSNRMAPIDSPRSQHLQAQAREAVRIDPLLAGKVARSPQRPLPLLAPHHSQHGLGSNATPPLRATSASPPRSSHSDSKAPPPLNAASIKASLSALLLHPSPSNSEPSSANPGSANSANSSPRTQYAINNADRTSTNGMAAGQQLLMEDKRALNILDKKFYA